MQRVKGGIGYRRASDFGNCTNNFYNGTLFGRHFDEVCAGSRVPPQTTYLEFPELRNEFFVFPPQSNY
jgi:hypothetical protein